MPDLPSVTVIVVATVDKPGTEDPDWLAKRVAAPLEGPVLAAIKSVEGQTYPKGLTSISIVRNVEGYPVRDMRRFAVERAETDYVAFISELETWSPWVLLNFISAIKDNPKGVGIRHDTNALVTCSKEMYLRINRHPEMVVSLRDLNLASTPATGFTEEPLESPPITGTSPGQSGEDHGLGTIIRGEHGPELVNIPRRPGTTVFVPPASTVIIPPGPEQ